MLCLAGAVAFAQTPGSSGGPGSGGSGSGGPGTPSPINPVSLKIPNEIAPPGGVAQMKFLNTEPTPISSGRPHGLYDDTMFDDIFGIQLFNATGDLNGVAMRNGGAFSIEFISNGAMQGTDYPVMTIALHVRPTAVPGTHSQFDLDPSSTFDVNSQPDVVKPIAPGTITVGGSISITNVVPGGGWRPAGSVIKVEGLGFQPRTQVQVSNVQAQSVSVVSPTEIDITLAQGTDMTGKKIQVVNPDGSQDIYFSYTRGINLGMSSWPLLSNAIPVFSSVSHSQATFTSVAPALPSQFTGLAMQNQNVLVANVNVSLFSAGNTLLGSSTIAVPPGYRLMREISELTGVAPSLGTYVVVASDQPIQVFGFLADNVGRAITPFAAAVAQP
jgi:hypothetical protein